MISICVDVGEQCHPPPLPTLLPRFPQTEPPLLHKSTSVQKCVHMMDSKGALSLAVWVPFGIHFLPFSFSFRQPPILLIPLEKTVHEFKMHFCIVSYHQWFAVIFKNDPLRECLNLSKSLPRWWPQTSSFVELIQAGCHLPNQMFFSLKVKHIALSKCVTVQCQAPECMCSESWIPITHFQLNHSDLGLLQKGMTFVSLLHDMFWSSFALK